jgi:hypothetical protein
MVECEAMALAPPSTLTRAPIAALLTRLRTPHRADQRGQAARASLR